MKIASLYEVQVLSTWTLGYRGGHRIALCKCRCGKEFEADFYKVKTRHTKSCGCLSAKVMSETMTTHGMRKTREHKIWCGMKTRCTNKNSIGYKDYGGRGISICESWLNSFENFYKDMGPCKDGFSIERKNVNGNYEKNNCIWIELKHQQRNKRNSIFLIIDGVKMHIKDASKLYGIKYATLRYRVINIGLSGDQAINYGK